MGKDGERAGIPADPSEGVDLDVAIDQTEDRLLLRALAENSGALDLHTAHIRYQLSPGQIASAVDKFVSLCIAEADGLELRLSKYGRDFCISQAPRIWTNKGRTYPWKDVPASMRSSKSLESVLYCPSNLRIQDQK